MTKTAKTDSWRKWTPERLKKFRATMAAKKATGHGALIPPEILEWEAAHGSRNGSASLLDEHKSLIARVTDQITKNRQIIEKLHKETEELQAIVGKNVLVLLALIALTSLLLACSDQTAGVAPSETVVAPATPSSGVLGALSLPTPAIYTTGPNSCPHGSPGGFRVTSVGLTATFEWNPAPSIHVYELLVQRDVNNVFVTVSPDFPRGEQDVRSREWAFKNSGSYRAFIRVHTACGDFGEWSPEFKFSLGGKEQSGPSDAAPMPPAAPQAPSYCAVCHGTLSRQNVMWGERPR